MGGMRSGGPSGPTGPAGEGAISTGASAAVAVVAEAQSSHQPGCISASLLSVFGAPKASSSAPSGPPRRRATVAGHTQCVPLVELHQVVADLHASTAGDHHVDLLLLGVAVAEGQPVAGPIR